MGLMSRDQRGLESSATPSRPGIAAQRVPQGQPVDPARSRMRRDVQLGCRRPLRRGIRHLRPRSEALNSADVFRHSGAQSIDRGVNAFQRRDARREVGDRLVDNLCS